MSGVGFNNESFQADIDAIRKGRMDQLQIVSIDVSAVTKKLKLAIVPCNAMALLAAIEQAGTVVTSSTTARIAFYFNKSEKPGLIFSRTAAAVDLTSFSGTIADIWYQVMVNDAGAPKMYVAFTTAVAMAGGAVGTSGAYSPNQGGFIGN